MDEIETLTFDELTDTLVMYEKKYQRSTVDMFRRYLTGAYEFSMDQLEWVSLFILYLGMNEMEPYQDAPKREREPLDPPPRYDAVFFEGMAILDAEG